MRAPPLVPATATSGAASSGYRMAKRIQAFENAAERCGKVKRIFPVRVPRYTGCGS